MSSAENTRQQNSNEEWTGKRLVNVLPHCHGTRQRERRWTLDRKFIGLAISISVLATRGTAQTVASSGATGTVGNIPYISAASSTSTTLSSSPISVSGGNVGIGTTNPQYSLQVNGSTYVYDNSFVWSSPFTSAVNLSPSYYVVNGVGNTGAITTFGGSGTSANENALGSILLYANANWTTSNAGNRFGGTFVDVMSNPASVTIQPGAGPSLLAHYYADPASVYTLNSQTLSEYGFFSNLVASPANGVNAYAFFGNGSAPSYFGGNVGIGTMNPQEKLEVSGNLRFTSDGSVQKTAWTGVLCGGDYAEAMNAAGGKSKYEPGDVLVLASDDNRDVQKSSEPYSTMVAGIVATKPGVVGLRAAVAKLSDNVPMAMVGVVPAKVSAENGPIHRGDLLVTASQPGYAMKGTDRSRMLGAVIGKAMGSLDSGTGVIEVLLTLQ